MKALGKAVIGGALLLTMFAPAGRADGTRSKNTVSWETIIGIIQPGHMVAGSPVEASLGRRLAGGPMST